MKKIVILVILIFLLSGCNASYTLNIEDNTNFSEGLYVFSENNEEKIGIERYKMPILVDVNDSTGTETIEKIDGYKYYDVKKDNGYINISTELKDQELNNSNIIKSCFKYFNFILDSDGYYVLSTSTGFKCMDKYPNINSINISITLPNEVVYTNTTNITDSTYTWTINNNNVDSASIFLKYKPKEIKNTVEETKDSSQLGTVLIILGSLIGLLFLLLIAKKNKNNK